MVPLKEGTKMKELSTAPELEVITFETEDVITTSLTNGGTGSGSKVVW